MIIVHLKKTWPLVRAGQMSAADATLRAWTGISDAALAKYGDVVAGVFDNTIVTVYDVEDARRDPQTHRIVFTGKPSTEWSHLVGQPNPGKHWGQQGDARTARYVSTDALVLGTAPVEALENGSRRAVVGEYTLTVSENGYATLTIPNSGEVSVLAR